MAKSVNGVTTYYVYDAVGQLVAEYAAGDASKPPCVTCYLSWDHLGTTRMVTDQSGNVVARHDFMPFGEELLQGNVGRTSLWGSSDFVNQKFTGQERDGETGLDYFHARYLGSGMGRFSSPDPGNTGVDLTDPQTWNGYSYVRNNPLALVDPSGACSVAIAGITQSLDPQDAFNLVASGLGAIQAYPYAGLGVYDSLKSVGSQANAPNASTAVAVAALQSALRGNAGNIDVIAYSGGAAAFTAAYSQLSPGDQSRIGSILYISPGARGSIFVNNETSVVRGRAAYDNLAMSLTRYPAGVATQEVACAHQDFACLSGASSAVDSFEYIERQGPCSSRPVVGVQLDPVHASVARVRS